MNRLNKILLSFVLPILCLLISVSNAFTLEPNIDYTNGNGNNSRITSFANYSSSTINTICKNYYNDSSNEEYISAFNDMISAFSAEGYDKYFIQSYKEPAGIDDVVAFFFPSTVDVCTNSFNSIIYLCIDNTESYIEWRGTASLLYKTTATTPTICGSSLFANSFYTNVNIKQTTPATQSYYFYWDGTSYFYKVESDEPDTPSLPSNSEIAQAVQSFYNSDYYKNNTDFKDFIVMYSYKTGYFSFIGHNYENKLQQLIFPAGHKYDQQWWKFGLDGLGTEISSYLWNRYYWLYSSNDFGENITYDGKGAFKDVLDIHWATSSIIVYSTTDYDVIYYTYNENNELTSEMETIPGDQYTYDENLDPTTNEYNPLENFVPTNPSQSILGDVDFNEINKVFEENKDILNIENASWLFSANNQLVSYFLGFLLLLIVFLIISRVLGG